MNIPVTKMRKMISICLVFMLFQSTIGVATLYTGIMYRNFDRETALEMLELVKKTDPNFYEKIINPEDDTYLREFENSYTEKRHTLMMVFGGIMMVFSFGCLAPLGILFISMIAKQTDTEEETKKKKPEPADDEF